MNIGPYWLKARLKLKALAKRFQLPTKVEPIDAFFSRHWSGAAPDSSYFGPKARFFFGPGHAREYREAIESNFADSGRETILRAERALAHTFDLLGSGEVCLGETINWHADFKSGRIWPGKAHGRIKIVYPDDKSDVKVPWELSRLQFLTDLGRAYFLTENDAYKDEFMAVLRGWEAANPVDIGVNWTCSMEVAIRAINIVWGMHFFRFDDDDREFVQSIIRLLYYHANHIEKNLEFISDGANSNHLISNYLGLFYIGLIFSEFDRSQEWLGIGSAGLENEMLSQVMPDGPDYEGSTSYHRLVLEMFLSAYALGARNNVAFSQNYRDRLYNMFRFSESVTGNSGLAPLIGDNDDGYIVKLAGDNPADHRPLIDVGRTLLKETASSGHVPTEERLWYLGPGCLSQTAAGSKSGPRLFPESSYAVIRCEKLHLVFNAFAAPEGNFGGHKHNDLLALTLEADGLPYLIDPGTFCYSSDFAMRNLSRSTSFHSTVEVDSCEQNRFLARRLFFLRRDAEAKIDLWEESSDHIIVSGFHTGYSRLGDSISHRRTITVFVSELSVVITDEFTGRHGSEHDFVSRLIMPNVKIMMAQDREVAIRRNGHPGLVIKSSGQGFLSTTINQIEYFPRYGVRERGYQMEFAYRGKVPFAATIGIKPGTLSSADTLVRLKAVADL
ncbi:MAG: hypothetical protein A2W25_01150 [candidate division Zixibacteria bacterium RBG_16_53_22]|nr:MAG: hypothetical protein A2W25_01150 [candidate division Zixibacteria bacterium RBG_16_53_22]